MRDRPQTLADQKLAEQRMDIIIGNLLRYGVIIAGTVVLLGGIFYLVRHGLEFPEYRIFRGEPVELRSFGGVFRILTALSPRGIIQFGFLLLLATPLARVAFSVFAFARQRDLTYVLVTLFVLAALVFSLAGGHL
jgi:uncharacterized membrane protein